MDCMKPLVPQCFRDMLYGDTVPEKVCCICFSGHMKARTGHVAFRKCIHQSISASSGPQLLKWRISADKDTPRSVAYPPPVPLAPRPRECHSLGRRVPKSNRYTAAPPTTSAQNAFVPPPPQKSPHPRCFLAADKSNYLSCRPVGLAFSPFCL